MSIKTSKPTVFLATADPEKSLVFYRDQLGLEFVEDSEYALVFNLSGADLRISKVPEHTPLGFTVLDWQVADMDAVLGDLSAAKVQLEEYDFVTLDERKVWTTEDGTQIAWFKDPDGNVLSVSQRS